MLVLQKVLRCKIWDFVDWKWAQTAQIRKQLIVMHDSIVFFLQGLT